MSAHTLSNCNIPGAAFSTLLTYSFVVCTNDNVHNTYSTYKINKAICDHCSYVHVCRNKLDGMRSNVTLHGILELKSRDFPAFRDISMLFQHLNTKYVSWAAVILRIPYNVIISRITLNDWPSQSILKIRGLALQEPVKRIYILFFSLQGWTTFL